MHSLLFRTKFSYQSITYNSVSIYHLDIGRNLGDLGVMLRCGHGNNLLSLAEWLWKDFTGSRKLFEKLLEDSGIWLNRCLSQLELFVEAGMSHSHMKMWWHLKGLY